MFKSAGIALTIFILIFENHAYSLIQTDSATSLGGAPVGLVSRTDLFGDSELLTSLGNAKVGSYHKQQYPIARLPLRVPFAVPYGLRLVNRRIKLPIDTVGKLVPIKPGVIKGRCRGGNCGGGGERVTNQNQLLGIEIGGIGGLFQGSNSGGNVAPGLLPGGLLGLGLLGL